MRLAPQPVDPQTSGDPRARANCARQETAQEIAMLRQIALVVVAVLTLAGRASADDQWGVNVAVTPSWQTGPGVKALFGADRIDMHGSQIRVGFVRGVDVDADWGFSFVSTTIAGGSSLDVDTAPCSRGTCGSYLRNVESTRMTGFEFHQFQPFKTWRE